MCINWWLIYSRPSYSTSPCAGSNGDEHSSFMKVQSFIPLSFINDSLRKTSLASTSRNRMWAPCVQGIDEKGSWESFGGASGPFLVEQCTGAENWTRIVPRMKDFNYAVRLEAGSSSCSLGKDSIRLYEVLTKWKRTIIAVSMTREDRFKINQQRNQRGEWEDLLLSNWVVAN